MLIVKETAPGEFEEVSDGNSFSSPDGTLNGWQCTELWSDTELNDIGVYRVPQAQFPPNPEVIVTGYHFVRVAGVVTQVLEVIEPLPPTQEQLLEYAASRRFDFEVGGIVSPMFGPLPTDRDTRAIVGQAIQSIDLGIVVPPVNFKTAGGFVPLDRGAFLAIATELTGFVQKTFDMEGAVDAKIQSGDITTKRQVDDFFITFILAG